MSVKIEFFGDDWAAIAAQMKAALGAGVVFEVTGGTGGGGGIGAAGHARGTTAAHAAADEIEGVKTKTRGPNKPKPEPTASGVSAEHSAEAEIITIEMTDEPKPEGLNYETDIKPLVLEIAGRFGRDKVMEVLAKYGVTNAGHVPVEDQPALMEDIRLVLEG